MLLEAPAHEAAHQRLAAPPTCFRLLGISAGMMAGPPAATLDREVTVRMEAER